MSMKSTVQDMIKNSKKLDAITLSPLDDDRIKTTELKSITTNALKSSKNKTVSIVLIET
jgi:hypothetical protein